MQGERQLFPEPPPVAAAAGQRPGDAAAAQAQHIAPAQSSPNQNASAHNSSSPGSRLAPVWLQRLSLTVLVLFCVYLGVLVAILPWWPRIWDQNAWIQARPTLAAVLHNGAVRGIISGLGLIDIWIGISEAVHYRDVRRGA